ncbi:hypothetical protein Z043_125261, partial [Scleropages formosus]
FCHLTLDPNTASRCLLLSHENRKATLGWGAEWPYPDHQERFDCLDQVLCREGLSGRCYWEAEWSGSWVFIGAAYRKMCRKGKGDSSQLGRNQSSWGLYCSGEKYVVCHNKVCTDLAGPISHRVGVYLDWAGGTLSFYSVLSNELQFLHTFRFTFIEPLYPAFSIGFLIKAHKAYRLDSWTESSSISLCSLG